MVYQKNRSIEMCTGITVQSSFDFLKKLIIELVYADLEPTSIGHSTSFVVVVCRPIPLMSGKPFQRLPKLLNQNLISMLNKGAIKNEAKACHTGDTVIRRKLLKV